ncbi:MAG: Hg(II)-responsive transcriptional regulator [Betaproteobacteria bacterium]|nr:Hg(II)-responsive transcriptional regulator [Betaproteobacteria bacterium]
MTGKFKAAYTIGQLANAAGVNVETVRYYHRIGLLAAPDRAYGSIRRYSTDSLQRLRFIKRAQRIGFTLEEVASLLKLADGMHCAETKSLAQHKLSMVQQKLMDLKSIETALKNLVKACDQASSEQECPIIASLMGVHQE